MYLLEPNMILRPRNLTVSSDSGAVKVIGEHDVSIENGYGESKDAFALKYKEKGLLNKKKLKLKRMMNLKMP